MSEPLSAAAGEGVAAPEFLETVHDLLEQLWERAPGVGDEDRMLFELAVVEIAGNVVEHARPRPVRCRLDVAVHADRLEATLTDTGVEAEVDLSSAGLPDDLAETGRGLPIVQAAVDELRHDHVDGVNRWYLRRTRTP